MISEIKLKDVATYKDEKLAPKKINFIYGNNGTGKTTISRFIENTEETKFSKSKIAFDESGECNKLTYNQDFVKINFNLETGLRGIYTFGEESEEKYKLIERRKKDKDELKIKSVQNKTKIESINSNNLDIKNKITDKLWDTLKKKYCNNTPELYKGYLGKKEQFFAKCISIDYTDDILDYDKIVKEYNLLYKEEPVEKSLLQLLDFKSFISLKNSDIFQTEIIENKDIKLSKLIDDLNNGNWVEEGLSYLEQSDNKCPFCQQDVTKEFISKIYSLYDGKYKKDKDDFFLKRNCLISKIDELKKFILENASLIDESELVANTNSYCDKVIEELLKKEKNLKYKCKFSNDDKIFDKFEKRISEINNLIIENNKKIKEISTSRQKLSDDAWKFLRNNCETELKEYFEKVEKNNTELKKIKEENETINKSINEIDIEIKKLEDSITSITKTITQINATLEKFNYTNFKLIENLDHLTYSIIRPDGSNASSTLSEGEFSFISFLYFYNLIFGSRTRSGLEEDHIIVIDDPVTSMDSNTLFIISTLIRELIELCLNDRRHIKQLFIFSHNLYFFKEVTYGYDDARKRLNRENVEFVVVSKVNGESQIKSFGCTNPIKTSYELLWNKLREKEFDDDSIQNTMRRILEQFLKMVDYGGPNNRNTELINMFDDVDKPIVKSLLSYINDGSHSIMDDLYISRDAAANENALKIFKQIFIKLGFKDHYNRMMNETEEEDK